jgi:hypothetical protein
MTDAGMVDRSGERAAGCQALLLLRVRMQCLGHQGQDHVGVDRLGHHFKTVPLLLRLIQERAGIRLPGEQEHMNVRVVRLQLD